MPLRVRFMYSYCDGKVYTPTSRHGYIVYRVVLAKLLHKKLEPIKHLVRRVTVGNSVETAVLLTPVGPCPGCICTRATYLKHA